MSRAADLSQTLAASDPTRPRLTWYDDADGPTRGERIELSGRVLANWVAKAANLLTDELGVERGDVVVIDLPAHWRAVYWALAAWRVGAVVALEPDSRAVAVVTEQPQDTAIAPGARVVAVSLPALARGWSGRALDGALDEAADLLSQPDVFEPFDEPDDGDDALLAGGEPLTAGELDERCAQRAAEVGWSQGERVALVPSPGARVGADGGALLVDLLATWSVDGSVVLVRDGDSGALNERWAAERVTSACAPGGTPTSRS
ncbi:MAG: TIGR03089 family protein [Angustibacter sp.]